MSGSVLSKTVLILHAHGDLAGGEPWAKAFEATGQWASASAPDLPGHGTAGPMTGGHYDAADPGFAAARLMGESEIERFDTVVGIGISGWSAQLVGLAGRADFVVLVDGLGDPYFTPEERLDRRVATTRAMVAGADPLSLLYPHGNQELADKAARAMPVPVLLGGGDAAMAEQAVAVFNNATIAELSGVDPESVATAAATWRSNPKFLR